MAVWTTDDLVAEVKLRCGWPSAGGFMTDSEILTIADSEMSGTVAPLIRRAREEFWVVSAPDVAIESGVSEYRVPSRALGSALRDVLIVDGDKMYSAPELPPEEEWRYKTTCGPWNSPFGYFLQGSYIQILPTPTTASYSLRLKYYRRPSKLVPLASAAKVSSAGGTTITTAATVPSAWGTSESVDIIDSLSPYDSLGDDLAGTSIATTNVTISAGVPSTVKAGDYVSLEETTPVPQIPDAVRPVLVLATMRGCLDAAGDNEDAAKAEAQLTRQSARIGGLIEPRVTGERPVVVNRYSALRGGGRWR